MIKSDARATRFYVSGIKSENSLNNANKSLQPLPGFESAEFNAEEGTAIVYGDIDPQAVCFLLNEAGFPAVVKSD
jgi:hypothetical protein